MEYQIIETIRNEHIKQGKLISKIEISFEECRKNLDLSKLKKLKNLLENVGNDLKEHFYIEETMLFPYVLNKKNKSLILDLEKEHIRIIDSIDVLNKTIEKILNGENVWIELRYNIKEFLHTLNDHILKEDFQLLPSIYK